MRIRLTTLADTQETLDTTPPILVVALRLAGRGIPVFPCLPGGKEPATPHGFKDATTNAVQVRRWWTRLPSANLAVPTGAPTWNVLDVDVRPAGDGYPALRRMQEAGLLTQWFAEVTTPSGGLHLYLPGTDEKSSRLPKSFLDWKAQGGYVLMPPSMVNDAKYTWQREMEGTGTPLSWSDVKALLQPRAMAPSALPLRRRRNAGSKGRRHGLVPLVRHVLRLQPGERNNGLYWAACRAVNEGHGDLTRLLEAGQHIGLSHDEAQDCIESARSTVAAAA